MTFKFANVIECSSQSLAIPESMNEAFCQQVSNRFVPFEVLAARWTPGGLCDAAFANGVAVITAEDLFSHHFVETNGTVEIDDGRFPNIRTIIVVYTCVFKLRCHGCQLRREKVFLERTILGQKLGIFLASLGLL